jgi:hypothetical protein
VDAGKARRYQFGRAGPGTTELIVRGMSMSAIARPRLVRSPLLFGFAAVAALVVVVLAATDPSRERHLAAMHDHAAWEAPYAITDAELEGADFQYQSYGICSVMRLRDGVYTYGILGVVFATERLRPLLVKVRTHQKID